MREAYRAVLGAAMRRSNTVDGAVVLSYEVMLPLLHLIVTLASSIRLLRRQPLE